MKKIEKIPNPKDFTLAPPPPPPRILNKQKSYANMIIYIFTLSLEIRKNSLNGPLRGPAHPVGLPYDRGGG